ncbi:hypothetical protein CSV74_12840 [Sporosarcina sp. P19]|nr:hypothetical protein CSV74_12840 [Sporosarcina sp. P19]
MLVMSLLFSGKALYNKWVEILVTFYYLIITFVFIYGYHRIHKKYNMYDGPVVPEGWDVNRDWAYGFSFAFIIPIAILVLYAIIQKIKPMEKDRGTYFIKAISLSVIVLFILFSIFNLAYGLSP